MVSALQVPRPRKPLGPRGSKTGGRLPGTFLFPPCRPHCYPAPHPLSTCTPGTSPFSFCPPPSPPCPLAVPRDLPRLPVPLSSCRVFSSLLLSASGRLSASASLSLPSLRWPPYWFPASAFPVSAHFPVFPLHFCRLTHSVSLILLQGLWLPTFPGWSRPPSTPPACTPRAGWGGSQVWGL